MGSRRLVACLALALGAPALLLAACASKPKGGRASRTVLSTTYDDSRVGGEGAREVAAQIGLFEDPALEAYIRQIGTKLLRGMPRRSFQYQFAIADQIEPNAFALPGGYVFVSRGLLALINNEDELANVIGHEITHAARRHAAARQALDRHQSPLALPMMRAAEGAAYGRDMEREADRGGQMLAAAAGYDPKGMSTFLLSLAQNERKLLGYGRLPTFLDTHPGSQERAASTAARAREIRWRRDPSLGDTRVSYLRRIDGLPYGERPETGVFQGQRFLQPELDFTIRFPAGWTTGNSASTVGAVSPRRDAIVMLNADMPAGDPEQVAMSYVEKVQKESKIGVKESKPVRVGSLPAWRLRLEGVERGTAISSYVTFIPYRGATWRITGASPRQAAGRALDSTLSTARSFRPLTEAERASIRSTVVRIATARPGEDLPSLVRRTGSAWDATTTAIANGVFVNHRFEGGELVKIARESPATPSR